MKKRKEGGTVGEDQQVSVEEAKEFVQERFGVELV